jgi:hypothetical protein
VITVTSTPTIESRCDSVSVQQQLGDGRHVRELPPREHPRSDVQRWCEDRVAAPTSRSARCVELRVTTVILTLPANGVWVQRQPLRELVPGGCLREPHAVRRGQSWHDPTCSSPLDASLGPKSPASQPQRTRLTLFFHNDGWLLVRRLPQSARAP